MRVAAIIINYRTAELTAKVVNALLPELEAVGPAHLYLIDNDSQDGSAAALRQSAVASGWGERVTLIWRAAIWLKASTISACIEAMSIPAQGLAP